MDTDDKGVIERAGDGAIPGVFVGFSVGAARAYLESRALTDKAAAATASALASKTPPTAQALRALRPTVSLLPYLMRRNEQHIAYLVTSATIA